MTAIRRQAFAVQAATAAASEAGRASAGEGATAAAGAAVKTKKSAVKSAVKPAVKPAVKSAGKSARKPARKPSLPAQTTPAAKPDSAGFAKPKHKLVRDSFTMPKQDFALVESLKDRMMALKRPTKKSELLRAGLHVLMALPDARLATALDALVPLKAGRPRKNS